MLKAAGRLGNAPAGVPRKLSLLTTYGNDGATSEPARPDVVAQIEALTSGAVTAADHYVAAAEERERRAVRPQVAA